jgi:exodeoxyribonuclease V alpha subunit
MVKHLSVRIPWHDRGWDGCICDDPKKNTFCTGTFSVNANPIRQKRLQLGEVWQDENRGKPASELEEAAPCAQTINIFSPKPVLHVHRPREFLGTQIPDIEETIPPYSFCTWRYDVVYEPGAGRREAKKAERLVDEYFDQFETDPRRRCSLVFLYLNYDNPLNAEEKKYVLVGILRAKHIGEQLRWEKMSKWKKDRYGDLVWSRVITHEYPDEGVRIPYQEYLNNGMPYDHILFEIDEDLVRRFKYVSRPLTDDDATIIIKRMIDIVESLKSDNVVKENWDKKLSWLNSILSEAWQNRGLFPGMGSVIEYLGFPNGTTYIYQLGDRIEPSEIRDYVFDRIEGKADPESAHEANYEKARKRWKALPDNIKALLKEKLSLFELTTDQVKRILSETREEWGISSSLEEIFENPYCIAEEYQGEDLDDTIGFYRIDNGMMPSPVLGAGEGIEEDDVRRIRAIIIKVLKKETSNGHSFLDLRSTLEKIRKERDFKDILIEKHLITAEKDFFERKLVFQDHKEKTLVYLKHIYDYERLIERRINQLIKRKDITAIDLDWKDVLKDVLKGELDPRFDQAVSEQTQSLNEMCTSPFFVLSGAAGTGKTTIIHAFIEGMLSKQRETFLLLAPTGKAAVRLKEKTKKAAFTIHHVLMKNGWLNENNYSIKLAGGERVAEYQNIIIDETSMVDLEILGALFKALDWGVVKRLILVGDPNQLPPIGVGKPFDDILKHLRRSVPENNLGILTVNCRLISKDSAILRFADLFTSKKSLAEEEMLNLVAKGGKIGEDLEVCYWEDVENFSELLDTKFDEMLNGEDFDPEKPYEAFNAITGITDKSRDLNLSAIQILSPYRGDYFGTDLINAELQEKLRGGLRGSGSFKPLDKIIQVVNVNLPKWLKKGYDKSIRDYVHTYLFNGALGYVESFYQGKYGGRMRVTFEIDPNISINVAYGDQQKWLELGYAISVHKAQGSEFDSIILAIPSQKLTLVSKELLYTALTRSRQRLVLLLQKNVQAILHALWPGSSELLKRNTSLFMVWEAPKDLDNFYPDKLIHTTIREELVRSKSELVIANRLAAHELSYYYEKPLKVSETDFVRPDFTIMYQGEEWYWEHLGLLEDEEYRKRWKRKEKWYKKYGFYERLITSQEVGGLDSKKIDELIEKTFPES